MILNARSLWLICVATASWSFSFGIGTQAVSHWLSKAQDANDTVVGLAHAFYYLGMAVGSFSVPWLTRRLGPTGCAAIGLIGSGATLLLFPWFGGELACFSLRFLNGWSGAMCVIPFETIVSRDSAPEKKTQNFGYFGLAMVLGGSTGMGISLHMYEIGTLLPFCLGGMVSATAASALAGITVPFQPASIQIAIAPLALVYNFLSYGTAWCQGFLEGFLVAFLSLYLVNHEHYSPGIAGMFVAITTVGIILLLVPISWLGDRCGKTPVLLGCYALTALGLFTIPWLTDPVLLGSTLFVFGACVAAMYPLALSLLTDRIPEDGMARAYAWFLAIECLGSVVGASAVGKARDIWGEIAMFPVGLAAVVAVLAAWTVLRIVLPEDSATVAAEAEKKNNRRRAA